MELGTQDNLLFPSMNRISAASVSALSRREFIARFAIGPVAAACLGPELYQLTSSYKRWEGPLCSFVGQYSSGLTFVGGGVLNSRKQQIPAALHLTVEVEDFAAAAKAFRTLPFRWVSVQGERIFFEHLGSFITIEHRLAAPSRDLDLDFEHQHLQLNPQTGVLNDPFEVAGQPLPMLRPSREPVGLVTGFENYLLGVLESEIHDLVPSDSFVEHGQQVLHSRPQNHEEASTIYAYLMAGLASFAGWRISDGEVDRLFRSTLVKSTLELIGSSSQMILKQERLLNARPASGEPRSIGCFAALLSAFPQTTTSSIRASRKFPIGPALDAVARATRLSRRSIST
jgi:hypothetical protein